MRNKKTNENEGLNATYI